MEKELELKKLVAESRSMFKEKVVEVIEPEIIVSDESISYWIKKKKERKKYSHSFWPKTFPISSY